MRIGCRTLTPLQQVAAATTGADAMTALMTFLAACKSAHTRLAAKQEALLKGVGYFDRAGIRRGIDKECAAAYIDAITPLIEAAYSGDAAAEGYITEAFGDQEFDPDGEEFGHYKTKPTQASAIEQARGIAGGVARHILATGADHYDDTAGAQ